MTHSPATYVPDANAYSFLIECLEGIREDIAEHPESHCLLTQMIDHDLKCLIRDAFGEAGQ